MTPVVQKLEVSSLVTEKTSLLCIVPNTNFSDPKEINQLIAQNANLFNRYLEASCDCV